MRIYFDYTESRNGGFSILGQGIKRELIKAGHQLVDSNPEVCITYGIPDKAVDARRKFPNTPLIYYTVWESSRYPETYLKAIKEAKIDLVLTATKFTRWVLSRDDIRSKFGIMELTIGGNTNQEGMMEYLPSYITMHTNGERGGKLY